MDWKALICDHGAALKLIFVGQVGCSQPDKYILCTERKKDACTASFTQKFGTKAEFLGFVCSMVSSVSTVLFYVIQSFVLVVLCYTG